MGLLFEEIDCQASELGDISLRRRRIPALGDDYIYEVKLGDEFLMSSLFVDAEVALADLGLAAVSGDKLRVVVGGLGLGHTARATLQFDRVAELAVIEALQPVIDWHKDGKVPLGLELCSDTRCHFIHDSFFDLAIRHNAVGFDSNNPEQLFHAILLDIDHSPSEFLNDANASFYTPDKLGKMAEQLQAGGVFAMWSNEPPDEAFVALLEQVFEHVQTHIVSFFNPFQNCESSNTVYVANTAFGD